MVVGGKWPLPKTFRIMIQLAGEIESIQSRADRSWKVTLGTSELNPNQIAALSQAHQKACYIAIKENPFSDSELEEVENTKSEFEDDSKSPSQRLRGVLFVAWKQNNEGYEHFHDYYIVKYEQLIKHFKSKLLP